MSAGESGGKLEVDVELAQTVRHQQLPLGFRSVDVLRAPVHARRDERGEAGFRRRFIISDLTQGKLKPSSVIRRDFRSCFDHLKNNSINEVLQQFVTLVLHCILRPILSSVHPFFNC